MRILKQISCAVLLTLWLTTSVLAGDIEIPGPKASSSAAVPGDIDIGGIIHTPGAPNDSAAEVALNMLLSAMSVF